MREDSTQRPVLVHITTVPQSLYAFFGGQIAFMKASGFDVQAISSPGDLLTRFGEREGIPVHAVEMQRAITPAHDLRAIWRLVLLLRKIRPTIVHAHTPKGGLLGLIAARLAGVPVRVYHVHGFPHVTAAGAKKALLRGAERVSTAFASRVYYVSRSLKALADEEHLGVSKGHVLASGSINGVDAASRFNPDRYDRAEVKERLGIPMKSPVVGFVGRIVKEKGIDELMEAWRRLSSACPQLRLLIVGELETQHGLSGDTERELLGNARIVRTGFVLDPAPYYAAMDVLALPSHREGFGLAALEASAMGVPVVASDIPGCQDSVAHGESGTLVRSRDPASLARALARYLEDHALREAHGRNGRKRAIRMFAPEQIWGELMREYEALVRRSAVTLSADAQPTCRGE